MTSNTTRSLFFTDLFPKKVLDTFQNARVTIVIPDATRPLDYTLTLQPLVQALATQKAEVRFYVGLGLHRPMTETELKPLAKIAATINAEIKQHRARSGALERTESGVAFHRRFILNAERIITVGVVEPHQYAGFSGGPKGLAIGCADAESIARFHHPFLLKNPNVNVGILTQNPFHEQLWRAVDSLPPIFGLFLVPNIENTPEIKRPGVFFGPLKSAYEEALHLAKSLHFSPQSKTVDWMHIRVPESKSQNFYQASRAATYLSLVKGSALRNGGAILLEATCPEGIGTGAGEQACGALMRKGSPYILKKLESISSHSPSIGGEQRAFILARSLQKHRIALVGANYIPELEKMGIPQFDSIENARTKLKLTGNGITVDHPFHHIPIMTDA